jgi:hypothetical protein
MSISRQATINLALGLIGGAAFLALWTFLFYLADML